MLATSSIERSRGDDPAVRHRLRRHESGFPTDTVVAGAAQVTGTTKLTIGGKTANAPFVGLSASGLCQVNAEVPDLPSGDAEVVLQIDSFTSADGAFITVQ